MWVFERDGALAASESYLEFGRSFGRAGSLSKVFLRCVKEEEVEEKVGAAVEEVDCEVWKRLPPDLASRIIFHHIPLPVLLQQGWPVDHLINFPPVQKHALFVDKVAFHNFSSRTSVELPEDVTPTNEAMALSPQGLLVAACIVKSTSTHCLACCHLPSSATFSLINLPPDLKLKKEKPLASSIPLRFNVYVHVFHPDKELDPASSYTLILALARNLFMFTSASGTWKRFTKPPVPSLMFYGGGVALQEEKTLPEMFLPKPFVQKSGVPVLGLDKRFKFMYSVCGSRSKDDPAAVLCCMRLDSVEGEWEVMPGPPRSIMREVNIQQTVVLGGDYEQGIAVFEDCKNHRLVVGFVEPWEWALSTNVITLNHSSHGIKQGSVHLLLP